MRNYDLEFAVVTSLMMDNSKIMEIDLITEEFAFEETRQIYQAIQDLTAQALPSDAITVAEYMDAKHGHANWMQRLSHFMDNAVPVNVSHYANKIREYSTKRKAVEIAQGLIDNVNADDGQEAVDASIKSLMEIGRTTRKYDYNIKETLRAAVDDIEASMESGDLPGMTTGNTDLDRVLGGFHDTDLVVIGARPAMGKTAFLLNCALAANGPVGLISGEQGYRQIGSRLIAIDGRVSIANIRRAHNLEDSDFARITGSVARMMEQDILINDKSAPTMTDIARQARQWKFRNNIKALYIDYIQRIKVDGKVPRHEAVGQVAMELKELARELEIPVIALAQVNRAVESRTDRRPNMSDLKDSGGIEQEADVVMTLYRDEVYNQETDEQGIIELIIQKNRHGEIGRVRAAWLGEYLRVESLEDRHHE